MEIAEAFITIKVDNARLKRELAMSRREFTKTTDKMKKAVKDVSIALVGIGAVMIASFGLLTKTFVDAGVSMEKMMKGLTAVSGSAEEAAKQLEELREVAKLPGLGLEEAIKASINLQAVRFSAEKATFFISEMGNALATVGKGRAELEGVVRGMQQMQSRGKVLAEEINQISERIPQFRAAMLDAFGTATSEEIQKLGITVEEFLDRTVGELAKLPRVAGGTANAIENLRDAWTQLATALGKALLPAFTKIVDALSKVVEFLNKLTDTQKSILAWGTVIGAGIGVVAAAIGGLGLLLPGITTSLAAFSVVFGGLGTVALGPIGIGITAIAIAVTGLALAFKEFGKSKKDVDLEQDTKALARNIEGIEASINSIRQAVLEIEKEVRTKGVKSISLLGTSLKDATGNVKGFDKELKPVEEQLERLRKRAAELVVELNFLRKTPKGIPGPKVEKEAVLSEEEKVILRIIDKLKIKANLEKKAREEQARRAKFAKEDAFLASRGQGRPGGDPIGIDREKEATKRIADFNEMIDEEQSKRQVRMLAQFREFVEARRKELQELLQLAIKTREDMDKRRDELAAKDKAMFKNLAEEEITTQADVDEAIRKGRAEGDKLRIARNLKTFRTLAAIERNRIASFKRVWNDFTLGVQQSFTTMFGNMLTGGINSWKAFAIEIKDIFLRQLAKIAVSAAFRALENLADRIDFSFRGVTGGPGSGSTGVSDEEVVDTVTGLANTLAPSGARLAPGGINIILPNADIENMSSARAERLLRRTFGPAQRRLEKRGIIARRM